MENRNKIDIYYELRELFNMPEKVFELYFELKSHLAKGRVCEDDAKILVIFPTKETANREFRKALSEHNIKYACNNKLIDERNREYTYCSINDILERHNNMDGYRYTDIRFLG